MPRKTNGIEFEIHPRPTKGEDGKPLLYVRPAKGMKRSFKYLDDYCTKYRGVRPFLDTLGFFPCYPVPFSLLHRHLSPITLSPDFSEVE